MDSDTFPLFARHRAWKLGHRGTSVFAAALSFTLVEMLVAITILTVLLLLASQIITKTTSVWTYANYKMTQGREARVAFSSVVSRLSEATVDQYYGYTNYYSSTVTNYIPGAYIRRSELRFVSGLATNLIPVSSGVTNLVTHATFFVAPLGIVTNSAYAHLPSLLNVCGYYIQWSNVDSERPVPPLPAGSGVYRFRLMQFVQPSEAMSVYSQTIPFNSASNTNGNYPAFTNLVTSPPWQVNALTNSPTGVHPLANNVVALLLLPATNVTDSSGTLATNFLYNSEVTNIGTTAATTSLNRVPPVMRVVMYTIDEKSALKLPQTATIPALYTGLFTNSSTLYTNSSTGDIGDLARFEATLTAQKLTYRRFDAAVQLPRQVWNTRN
jgi:uncharacterized protein (TIGR02599 family)